MAKYQVKLDFWIDGVHNDNAEKDIENFIKESLDGSAHIKQRILKLM